MKITKTEYKINNLQTLKLNRKVHYKITNIKLLAYCINERDIKINELYQNLLFSKITQLKTLKNNLLEIRFNLKNIQEQDFYKIYTTLKNKFPSTFKNLDSFGLLPKLSDSQKNILFGSKKTKQILKNGKLSTKTTTKGDLNFYLTNLNANIEYLDSKIKDFQEKQANKTPFKELSINNFDLIMLKKGKFTNNLKILTNFKLQTLNKINYNKNKRINSDLVINTLDNYQKIDAYNDIDLIIKQDLINFENWFLNKYI